MNKYIYNLVVKFELPLLFSFLILLNISHMLSLEIPIHDTLQVYHIFHYCYCSLWYYQVVPEWMPYSTFGIPSITYHCCGLTPCQYVTCILGIIFSIQDTLFLFKLSVIFEQCIFTFGIYWLCILCFNMVSIRWIVYCSALLGLDWWTQIWWNFRIYEYWPLIIASLITFILTRQSEYFWLAIFSGLMSLNGNLIYFLPVYILVGIVCLSVLAFQYGLPWRSLIELNIKNVICFTSILILACIYFGTASQMMNGLEVASIVGRDPDTMNVTLYSFLTYGGIKNILFILQQHLYGYPIRFGRYLPDQTVYIGLVPFLLSLYGLVIIRGKMHTLFAVCALTLLLFSSGGLFSTLCYYLIPTMDKFRHINYLWSFQKIFILFMGSICLQSIIKCKNSIEVYFLIPFIIILTDVLFNGNIIMYGWGDYPNITDSSIALTKYCIIIVIISLSITINCIIYNRSGKYDSLAINIIKYGLFIFSVLDMCQFYYQMNMENYRITSHSQGYIELFNVSKMEYQEQRLATPSVIHSKVRNSLMLKVVDTGISNINQITYNYLQHDPAGSEYFVPILAKPVKDLIKSRNNAPSIFQFKDIKQTDRTLSTKQDTLFGCYYPKVHVVNNSVKVDSKEKCLETVKNIQDFSDKVVLISNEHSRGAKVLTTSNTDQSGRADYEVTSFTPNRLKISISNNSITGTKWLVYTDAFHPSWSCKVNNQPSQVLQANYAFKAVEIDSQTKDVEFIYNNNNFTAPCLKLMILGVLQLVILMGVLVYISYSNVIGTIIL